MIKLSRTENGFSIYDYKNASFCAFELINSSEIVIKVCNKLTSPNDEVKIEIEESDNNRFAVLLEEFLTGMEK